MISKTVKLVLPLLLCSVYLIAQTTEEQYAKAVKLKTEYNYKEAFPLFQKLLKTDSTQLNYLCNASYCYTKYGFYFAPDAEKLSYYKTAEYLSKKAIQKNGNSADAHYTYAMALGRLNENASSKQKIANAKLIKSEVDRAIVLNPKLAGAYHILGRWHRTIAGFNMIEKAMINSFFGGVPPGGSYEDAVKAFMTAITLEPAAIIHQYELAETYHEMGKNVEAKVWAKKVLEMNPVSPDDKKAKTDCEALLKKLD
jgi:tetratricopeptide (TPR) repeat protein